MKASSSAGLLAVSAAVLGFLAAIDFMQPLLFGQPGLVIGVFLVFGIVLFVVIRVRDGANPFGSLLLAIVIGAISFFTLFLLVRFFMTSDFTLSL